MRNPWIFTAVLVCFVTVASAIVEHNARLEVRVRLPHRTAEKFELVDQSDRKLDAHFESALAEVYIRVKSLRRRNKASSGNVVEVLPFKTGHGGTLIDRSQYRLAKGDWSALLNENVLTGWRSEQPLSVLGWRGVASDITMTFKTGPTGGQIRIFRDSARLAHLNLYSDKEGWITHTIESPTKWLRAQLPLGTRSVRLHRPDKGPRQPLGVEILQGEEIRYSGPGKNIGTHIGLPIPFTLKDRLVHSARELVAGHAPLVRPLARYLRGIAPNQKILLIGSYSNLMGTGLEEPFYAELHAALSGHQLTGSSSGRAWEFGRSNEVDLDPQSFDYLLIFQGYHFSRKRPGLLELKVANEVFRLYKVSKRWVDPLTHVPSTN